MYLYIICNFDLIVLLLLLQMDVNTVSTISDNSQSTAKQGGNWL